MTKVGTTRASMDQRSQASFCSARSPTRANSRSPSQPLAVYDHVLRLLGFDQLMFPDHPVIEALQHGGYTDFPSLFMLRRADVESLTYIDTDVQPPVRTPLPLGNQTRLLVPQGYRNYFETTNKRSLNPSDWMCITVDDIRTYMMSSEFMFFNNSLVSTKFPGPLTIRPKSEVALNPSISSNESIHPNHLGGSIIAPALSSGDSKRKSAKELSQKPMKRDLNCFKTFSDKRYWTTWYQHFVATARAQDLQDILDPNYIPSTPIDKDVFTARQEYLYSVFVHILQTKEGKALVRSKFLSNNAQSIFTSLCAHYLNVKKTNHQQQRVVQTDYVLQLCETHQLCTTNPADSSDSSRSISDPMFVCHNLKDKRTSAHLLKDACNKTLQFNKTQDGSSDSLSTTGGLSSINRRDPIIEQQPSASEHIGNVLNLSLHSSGSTDLSVASTKLYTGNDNQSLFSQSGPSLCDESSSIESTLATADDSYDASLTSCASIPCDYVCPSTDHDLVTHSHINLMYDFNCDSAMINGEISQEKMSSNARFVLISDSTRRVILLLTRLVRLLVILCLCWPTLHVPTRSQRTFIPVLHPCVAHTSLDSGIALTVCVVSSNSASWNFALATLEAIQTVPNDNDEYTECIFITLSSLVNNYEYIDLHACGLLCNSHNAPDIRKQPMH